MYLSMKVDVCKKKKSFGENFQTERAINQALCSPSTFSCFLSVPTGDTTRIKLHKLVTKKYKKNLLSLSNKKEH